MIRFRALVPILALACVTLACRPTAEGGLPEAGEPLAIPTDDRAGAGLAASPGARPAGAAPRVRVVPGATPEPAPPGMVVEPSEVDPEVFPAGEGLVTLEAPAEWRGANNLHLQLVMPNAEDPDADAVHETVAVDVELRKDGILRDPVVLRTRVDGERLAAGQVALLLANLKDESYELVVRAIDRADKTIGEAERDFGLDDGRSAPYLVRLPAARGDFKIDEASRPYLQAGTPTSMTIMWTSARSITPAITVSDAAGAEVVAREEAAGTRHRFVLEGLEPGAAYRWTAREDGGAIASGTFHTNAGPEVRRLRFAAFGDSGRGTRAQFEVARRIAAWKPEFALVAGDVVYPNGEAKHYEPRFLAPYHELIKGAVFYPSLGNHDYRTNKAQPYLDFFEVPRAAEGDTERYYTFRWGHAEFFALDSNQDYGPASPQTRWFEKALAASEATWKVAFFHHPPYSGGTHGSTMKLREAWEPIFEKHDVQLVVSGHDHHYERMKPQEAYVKDGVPTHHVLTGGGGAGLRSVTPQAFTAHAASRHHFVGVTIDDRTLAYEAIDNRGTVFDRFSYTLPE